MTSPYVLIPDYEGYAISKDGIVVSFRNSRGRLDLSKISYVIKIHGTDWKQVRITIQNVTSYHDVHFLLAKTFIPNPENQQFVIHVDGNKLNNDLSNLKWHFNNSQSNETEWFPIEGYPSYEISRTSVRIKSSGLLVAVGKNRDDYPTVQLSDGTKSRVLKIHRLMAIQFIPNPNNLPVVNHINGEKQDYAIDNLEWVTLSENTQHAVDTGARSKTHKKADQSPIEGEIWVPVRTHNEDYNKSYEVSNMGRARSVKGVVKSLKLSKTTGYQETTLVQKGKTKTYLLHRLIYASFYDLPEGFEINHKNKIRNDNKLENLEALSVLEHRAKDSGHPVVAISEQHQEIKEFPSMGAAARAFGVKIDMIARLVKNDKMYEGYFFFKADDPVILETKSKMEMTE